MTEDESNPAPETELISLRLRNTELETALHEAQAASGALVIRAELKTEAVRRGIIDLDGLKLVEHGGLTVNEHGEVAGASAAVARLQREKPWLFAGPNSSSLIAPPPTSSTKIKPATEMTLAEWRTARQDLLRRK